MVTINLPHEVVCTEERCFCTRQVTGVTDHDPKTGAKTVRAVRRKLAGSITFTAFGHDGDTIADLPLGVARLPEVRAMEQARKMLVTRHDNDKHMQEQAAAEQAKAAAKGSTYRATTFATPPSVKE